jgi:hypothetical protein
MFAAAALLVMLGGALAFLNTSDSSDNVATVAPVSHTEPLELVALGHARVTNVLTISGTVRNPSSGAKVEGLTAVISLLDRSGDARLHEGCPARLPRAQAGGRSAVQGEHSGSRIESRGIA